MESHFDCSRYSNKWHLHFESKLFSSHDTKHKEKERFWIPIFGIVDLVISAGIVLTSFIKIDSWIHILMKPMILVIPASKEK